MRFAPVLLIGNILPISTKYPMLLIGNMLPISTLYAYATYAANR